MLTRIECKVVRQPDGAIRRSWYQSVTQEVELCHDVATGALLSFEIDWDRRGERAYVTWTRGKGAHTGKVDTGEGNGSLGYKASPVIIADLRAREELIVEARRLIERSSIEEGLRESVMARL